MISEMMQKWTSTPVACTAAPQKSLEPGEEELAGNERDALERGGGTVGKPTRQRTRGGGGAFWAGGFWRVRDAVGGWLTMGKMVANTLISSDFGVGWCSQFNRSEALPIMRARLDMA